MSLLNKMVDNVTQNLNDVIAYIVPNDIRVLESVILSLICGIALFGNTSLWIVILTTRDLRKESNYLILCLSFADILVSLGMPITIFTILDGDWTFGEAICQVFGFINTVTFISSVMSLGVISINRYVKICRPHQYNTIYSRRNIFIMVGGVWIFSSALATPPLIGWGVYDYLLTQYFCFCDWTTSISYTFFMVGTCFGGPCTVMTVSYLCILRTLRASSRKVFNSVPSETPGNRVSIAVDDNSRTQIIAESDMSSEGIKEKTVNRDSRISTINEEGVHRCSSNMVAAPESKSSRLNILNRKEKRRREEIRITILFLVVILAFVLSWLPFCIAMFLTVFLKDYSSKSFDIFTLLLGYANSCYNPFIYGFMNQRFKQAYKTLFSKIIGTCKRR